jgi:catechol 2,3-dioxygenase
MSQASIHPDTSLGYAHLTVADLERSLKFYQEVLGFQVRGRADDMARLGAGRDDILRLTELPGARPAHRTTGLYHFAVLTPSRLELARSLRRLGETRWPVQGFADHLVSEAIYLSDPDGNGIELYRDRPRSEWPRQNGQLQMATDPMDVDGVLAELEGDAEPWPGLHPDTRLGHLHLHVRDIREAEEFYCGLIGFDLILRYGGSASFVSAGGYHHHLGFNTWAGVGAPPPPPDAVGLRYFVVRLPEAAEVERLASRARQAGVEVEETPAGVQLRDPSSNAVVFTAPGR